MTRRELFARLAGGVVAATVAPLLPARKLLTGGTMHGLVPFAHQEYGLGFTVTENMLDGTATDELQRCAELLAFSARHVIETRALDAFENGKPQPMMLLKFYGEGIS